MRTHDAKTVSDAIVTWTGWGESSWPARDEQRIKDRFGENLSEDLVPILHRLERDFYESDAHLSASDLSDMGRLAGTRFRKMHPELSDEAVEALTWCYVFDYK
jgi:hypothetical protein